jgi:hypothetical protein
MAGILPPARGQYQAQAIGDAVIARRRVDQPRRIN